MQAITQKLTAAGRIVSTVQTLPSGVAGTQRTLALMHESILAVLTSELLLAAAFLAAGLANRATTARAEVERVQQWVQKNIRYVLDPLKVELLQSPTVTLQRKQGDCDDQTMLLCSLLSSLGYQCRMVAIGFTPGTYAHVYAEVNIDGKWVAAETIKPWPLGKEPEGVKNTMRMIVNAPASGELSGLFSKLKSIVKPVVNNPVTRVAAAAATGGQSELYYQTAAALKAAKPAPAPTVAPQPAPQVSPLPASAVAGVQAQQLAPQPMTQVTDFINQNPVPVAIGAGLLVLVLVLR